jgi:hypothetical protein
VRIATAPFDAEYAGRTGRPTTPVMDGQIHDGPAAGGDHGRQDGAAHQERALHVDPQRLVPVRLARVQDGLARGSTPGVVDQDVDAAEPLERDFDDAPGVRAPPRRCPRRRAPRRPSARIASTTASLGPAGGPCSRLAPLLAKRRAMASPSPSRRP